jgi:hypothetical protein
MGKRIDRTIQLKRFLDDEDDPYEFFEWRDVDLKTFIAIKHLLKKSIGDPMDRSGD